VLNAGISKAREHSLNDAYVEYKLLQIQTFFKTGFYTKALESLRSNRAITH
jgi:hypothetical protein